MDTVIHIDDDLAVRVHGEKGPPIVVLHGGPAAVGSAGPIARGLCDSWRVYEPWQRGSGDEPLTVARHVADLERVIQSLCGDGSPALIGESWGAMLALAYAAAHPARRSALLLVGCGTFDVLSRQQLQATIQARLTAEMRQALAAEIAREAAGSDGGLLRQYRIIQRVYEVDPIESGPDPRDQVRPFDETAHRETWADMLRCQERGIYPEAFRAITAPALMLHGDWDPHPGAATYATLSKVMPQLRCRGLSHCGHSPWNERRARAAFFRRVRQWLRDPQAVGGDGRLPAAGPAPGIKPGTAR